VNREPRIDAYIARAAPFAQPILEKARERVHAVIPDAEETIKWSMPAYTVGGKIMLITAAFKGHAALNFWRGQELESSHASVGAMGQFGKLKGIEDVPPDAELDRLIREAAELAKASPAPRKAKHEPKQSPKAKATLDGFPPSARRDYLEWIADAKEDATRQKRIVTAIEWLCEGKRRHWKYENC
jgi:uncharacterized protein YdeI (YjbR/CyaY-like superfamily)